ncbi:MAG TPA: alpha/beta hydrolase [Ktedonobacterales bacterium]
MSIDAAFATATMPVPGDLDVVWTTLDGMRVYGRVSPPGTAQTDLPPVVLVHGLSVSSRYLMPAARALAPFRRVFVPDLPGFGYSQKPPHVLDLPRLADALAAWTRAMGLERTVFIGHSLGCQTVCNLALRHPELVEGAVLLGPTMDPRASSWQEFFRLMVDMLLFEQPRFLGVTLLEFAHTGPWWAQRTFHYALNDDVLGKYARMHTPALVVRGEHDPIAPARWAEELVDLLPEARPVVTVPGTGHCPHDSSPSAFLDAVLPFLSDLECERSPLTAEVRESGVA